MTINILKYSHHFALESPHERYQHAITEYAKTNLLQVSIYKSWDRKVVKKYTKLFAVRTKDPLTFRFHINLLDEFMDYMRTKGYNNFNITEVPMYAPAPAEFKIVTDKSPRDIQPSVISYLVGDGSKKVIELATGMGKTLCSLFAISQIGQRTLLVVKPMYIKRWLDDLTKKTGIYKLSPKELTVVQGSKALASVILMAKENRLPYKFIIISNKTLYHYYDDYVNGENMDKYHNVKPYELMPLLKIGVRLIDEAHQDFHQCYTTDLFTHVPKTIELSATLVPDDVFLQRMYETVYPKETRYGGGVYHKYIAVEAIPFRLDRTNKNYVKYNMKGRLSYSHSTFEESIMKDKQRLSNYIEMVKTLTKEYFIDKRCGDCKLLIFAERVNMCEELANALSKQYPHLSVTKYTQEEDYNILAKMDIIVSTPKSAGTAVDIPKLQVCINTVAIGSTQTNLQMIGRLRQLHGLDVTPKYVYTYCMDIDKPVDYHVKRRDFIFKDRALSFETKPISFTI